MARCSKLSYSNYQIPYINEANCSALFKSFQNYKNDYACDMLTVYLSAAVSPDAVAYAIAVNTIRGRMLLKMSILLSCLIGGLDAALPK